MDTSLLKITQTEDDTKETIYKGIRTGHNATSRGTCSLVIDGIPFVPVDARAGVPYFEWGCRVEGAKRLAMVIIHDLFSENFWTPENHNALLRDVITTLPFEGWEIKESTLLGWLDVLEEKRVRDDHEATMELIEAAKTK